MTKLERKFRGALREIVSILGSKQCADPHCPGCEAEMEQALGVAKKAFRLRTSRKMKV